MASREEINALKVEELKEKCKAKGLSTAGKKTENEVNDILDTFLMVFG